MTWVRMFLKLLVFVVGLVSLALVGMLWFMYLTYIHETTTEGSAYGYTIGQSKEGAFEVASEQFTNGTISGIHVSVTYDPTEAVFPEVAESDRWRLFPGERDDFFDSVKLTFEDGKLIKIHRHRQRFELP